MAESSETPRAYLPIEDYGVIGDLHTVALVGKNGSIEGGPHRSMTGARSAPRSTGKL